MSSRITAIWFCASKASFFALSVVSFSRARTAPETRRFSSTRKTVGQFAIEARVKRLRRQSLNPAVIEITEIGGRAPATHLHDQQSDVAEDIDVRAVRGREVDVLDDRDALLDHITRAVLLVWATVDDGERSQLACVNKMRAGIGKSRLTSRVIPESALRLHSSSASSMARKTKRFDDRGAIILQAREHVRRALGQDRKFIVGELEQEIDAPPFIDLGIALGRQPAVAIDELEEG